MCEETPPAVGDTGAEPDTKLAFEQTIRGLDRQAAILDQLRSRGGIILSASGIVASLLGSQALKEKYSLPLAIVALGSTAIGMLLCVWVLWPAHDGDELPEVKGALPRWNRWPRMKPNRRREWQITIERDEVGKLRDKSMVSEELLDKLDRARHANYLTIERRSKAFGWACFVLGIQFALWATVLMIEAPVPASMR